MFLSPPTILLPPPYAPSSGIPAGLGKEVKGRDCRGREGGREGERPESKGNGKTTRETSNASNEKTTEMGWVWRRREEGKEVGR